MFLYKPEPRFDPRTGKPLAPILKPSGYVCDYTGIEIHPEKDYEQMPLYNITIDYNHDSEPIWYEDKERYILEKEYGIGYGDFSNFLDSTYHFMNIGGYGSTDVSTRLVSEWVDALKGEQSKTPLHSCHTIEQAFRVCRLRTLMRLLNEKKYTLEKLGFFA